MSATYLDDILIYHRARAARDERDWRTRDVARTPRASLVAAISAHREHGIGVIAEIKRRSPSKGWLAEGLDAVEAAQRYVEGGALGVSVLTDEAHFAGSLEDLRAVSAAVSVPVLRKDFTVAPNDVLDAVESGASAVLLIVAALSNDELSQLLRVAAEHEIDALVEVHDVDEASRASDLGANLIGVNQRDLHTFAVDVERAERVVASLDSDIVAVAESGFSTPDAVASAARAGFDAVLVGESFVRAKDRASAVRSFVGFEIGARR